MMRAEMTISPSSWRNWRERAMENVNKYVGKTFGGRYKIISAVGVGGMSVVYGAYDTVGCETVALKLLDLENCPDEESVDEATCKFLAEAEKMCRLSHPNIVNIKGVSDEEDPPYFIMEYVEANTLKTRITACGALPPEEIIFYTKQILHALIHVHSQNIVHCDIKPQNIMLLEGGQIKLTDFGIARIIDSEDNVESDKAVGTVYYISPEQASGRVIDGRSDIYSLGVMMYEMATGRLPFSAEDTSAVSRMHIEQSPTRPRVFDPEIPTGLEQIILHAMEKTPFMRFFDAETMLDAVETLEKYPDVEFEFNREKKIEQQRKADSGTSRGLPILLGAAAAFIVALIAAVILIVSFGGRNAPTELFETNEEIWNTEITEK